MANVTGIVYDNKDLYLPWIFDEVDILSNALLGLAMFRKRCGERWPNTIVVHRNCRLSFGLGEDVRLRRQSWGLRDAIYFSLFEPYVDTKVTRRMTRIPKQRKPILDDVGEYFRFRKDLKRTQKKIGNG